MVKAGFDDADERDALKVVLTAKALYLAYREVLTDIQDVAVRAYVQGAIEKAGPVPLGDQPGTMAQNPMPPRGVVAPLVPPPAPVVGLPPSSPRGPVPPGPTVFTPPKIGRP